MNYVHVKIKLDEKHSMIGGSARIIASNPKTLTSTKTHQGAWKVVVPISMMLTTNNFLKNFYNIHTL